MGFAKDELSKNAKGGTELQKNFLERMLPTELLENVQIYPSRIQEARDETKTGIFWAHDLAQDPAVEAVFKTDIENFVFVSNWSMEQYNLRRQIPYGKSTVIHNGIIPSNIEDIVKPTDKVKIIYHTTPHRGLELLVPIFAKLCETYDYIELDVYSGFGVYGWEERDAQYKQVFDACKEHPKINFHGAVSNDVVRKALNEAHIFAYPSIWTETSCIALMEAMTSKVLCVHPNRGALVETAAGCTNMYQDNEDYQHHALTHYHELEKLIIGVRKNYADYEWGLAHAKAHADVFYDIERTAYLWTAYLKQFQK